MLRNASMATPEHDLAIGCSIVKEGYLALAVHVALQTLYDCEPQTVNTRADAHGRLELVGGERNNRVRVRRSSWIWAWG